MVLPLVPPGGIIMAHNTRNLRSELREFIDRVQSDPQLQTELVEPGPGGFSVSVKLPAK
jgi:predicted O-methyltransferase YrrM